MSYALGQVLSTAAAPIVLGDRARTDPVMSLSSMIAAGILKEIAPARRRRAALRRKLNALQPGMAAVVFSKARQLKRQGVPENQAVFDGLRLAIANRFAATIARVAKQRGYEIPSGQPISGLGALAALGDIGRDIACTILGFGTIGATIAMTFENPSGSEAVTEAGTTSANIAGCNREQLEAQARIAEANARAAEAEAARRGADEGPGALTYVAIGGGVLLLLGVGVLVMKK